MRTYKLTRRHDISIQLSVGGHVRPGGRHIVSFAYGRPISSARSSRLIGPLFMITRVDFDLCSHCGKRTGFRYGFHFGRFHISCLEDWKWKTSWNNEFSYSKSIAELYYFAYKLLIIYFFFEYLYKFNKFLILCFFRDRSFVTKCDRIEFQTQSMYCHQDIFQNNKRIILPTAFCK